jgi:hypothetical protein
MARYRIVRRISHVYPSDWAYDVQERQLPFWWETISGSWSSLEEAERALMVMKRLKTINGVPEVVKEYD